MKYGYKVTGYVKKTEEYGNIALSDAVSINVIAEDEKEAIKLAKKIVKKPEYRVQEAGTLDMERVTSIELQKQHLELNKQIFELNKQTKENIASLAKAIDKLAAK